MGGKLLTLQIFSVVAFMQLLVVFTAAIYPDASNCFKGTNQNFEEKQADTYAIASGVCYQKNPGAEKGDLCFKVCMLKARFILLVNNHPNTDEVYQGDEYKLEEMDAEAERRKLGVNYTISAENAAAALGLYDENFIERFSKIEKQIAECDNLGFMMPKGDEKDYCKDLDPKYHVLMQEIVTCVEEALKCEIEDAGPG